MDVSGSFGDSDHHVVTAVCVHRSDAERLLERLFDIDMLPWLGKWSQFKRAVDDPHRRVATFAEELRSGPSSWSALYYEGEQTSEQIASAVGIAAGRAISQSGAGRVARTEHGVLIYDGGENMLGRKQRELRQQATESFNDGFVETYYGMSIASLVRADEKYPEVTAADLLGGHVRETLAAGQLASKPVLERLGEIGPTWSPPQMEPTYDLCRLSEPQFRSSNRVESRIVAWLRGVAPDSAVGWSPSRFEAVVEQEVESKFVRSKLKRLPRASPASTEA